MKFLSPKMKRRIFYLFLMATLLFSTASLIINYMEKHKGGSDSNSVINVSDWPELSVLFIDVGQADSALISLGTGETMLIDAGESSDAPTIMEELDERHITNIDILVATHPHSDHIGGMSSIIEHYSIGRVLMPDMRAQSSVYLQLMDTIHAHDVPITEAYAGYKFSLGHAECTVVSPDAEADKDANNESVVIFLDFDNSEFLFAGDMEEWAEDVVLDNQYYIDADVLKVAHHGSSTSSSLSFLDAVTPQYAVISCGRDNEYGHPHQKTLDRLLESDVLVYRTDEAGDILFLSDGLSLTAQTGD